MGRNWEPLLEGVAGHSLERERTAEAKRRLADLRRDDADGRVRVATWMLDEGLQAEALAALNHVLSRWREHPGALQLIAGRVIEVDLGDAGEALSAQRLRAVLKAGARGPAAESEVAVRELAAFEGRTDLRHLVEVELSHPNFSHRIFAILAARRLFAGEFLTQLVDRALLDSYEGVREPAAEALAGAREVAVLAPMIRALASEHGVIRLHAIEAMGRMGYPAAVEPLVIHLNFLKTSGSPPVGTRANLYIGNQTAIVGDYDVEIAQGASIADPIVGVVASGVILDVRVVAQITKAAEQRAVVSALRQLNPR